MSPHACRRGTVVTCSRTIYPTAARLQVRACLVVLGTGMGWRAALCAHGRDMPVTRVQASPAADAPSRARRLCRADARSSGEGAAARTKRERVGRAGDIADARAVVCRMRVSVLLFLDR